MRNIFIRVTEVNETKNGVIKYGYSDIENMISNFINDNKLNGMCYYVLHGYLHGEIIEGIKPHFHILLTLESDIGFNIIKKYFPYGNIEEVRDVLHTLRYLTHFGYNKKQDFYELSDILIKQFYNGKIKHATLF